MLTGDRDHSECPVSAADDEVIVAQRAAQMIERRMITLDDMDGYAARGAEVVSAEQARAFRQSSSSQPSVHGETLIRGV